MHLVDSSVWVDYLRSEPSRATGELRAMLSAGEDLAITEPIVLELLAGAATDQALSRLERLTDGLALAAIDPRLDYRDAATIYRTARRAGRTVRRLDDCLIAAVAIRRNLTLVHKDADLETIADFIPLRSVSLR